MKGVEKKIKIGDVISHYNIVGLGIGVAIGIAGKDVAFSLANDVILPLIGKVVKSKFFDDYILDWDKFLGFVLTFAIIFGIIIFLLYVVLKPMVRQEIENTEKENDDVVKELQEIKEEIRMVTYKLKKQA